MAVEADDRIGFRHDDMEIVGNEQDTAAGAVADLLDQLVKGYLPGKIDPLHRLVQDQQVGFAGDSAGKQRPLELATRKVLYLGLRHVQHARRCERLLDSRPLSGPVSVISRSTVKGSVQSTASFCGT